MRANILVFLEAICRFYLKSPWGANNVRGCLSSKVRPSNQSPSKDAPMFPGVATLSGGAPPSAKPHPTGGTLRVHQQRARGGGRGGGAVAAGRLAAAPAALVAPLRGRLDPQPGAQHGQVSGRRARAPTPTHPTTRAHFWSVWNKNGAFGAKKACPLALGGPGAKIPSTTPRSQHRPAVLGLRHDADRPPGERVLPAGPLSPPTPHSPLGEGGRERERATAWGGGGRGGPGREKMSKKPRRAVGCLSLGARPGSTRVRFHSSAVRDRGGVGWGPGEGKGSP